ncbi:YoaK family protein [Hugenholtzia roseola]|uniref:YoaK family protein n=1 Tax=Hugenholtzia roseola TaxID=1002 RepID=UPI00040FC87C|nr:YoaK family protein [Hugenholtzia roseola]
MLFRTQDSRRRFFHDLKLASILSISAGAVNSAGFFAFDVLTTNVTGHVALLANDLVAYNWNAAYMKMLWMFLFLLGAFVSSLWVQFFHNHPTQARFAHSVPLILEMGLLAGVAILGHHYFDYSEMMIQLLAGSLLFAMGLQNALITIVSGSVIRTTHLTGLFTDLGVNFAKLLFNQGGAKENLAVRRKLALLLTIAGSFFLGGMIGGFLFASYLFFAFIFPLLTLLVALLYDIVTYQPHKTKKATKIVKTLTPKKTERKWETEVE